MEWPVVKCLPERASQNYLEGNKLGCVFRHNPMTPQTISSFHHANLKLEMRSEQLSCDHYHTIFEMPGFEYTRMASA